MNVQSLSIDVPVNGCVNHCKFCVSRLHINPYPTVNSYVDMSKRMQFAANNGCNTVILTGTGEPQQNGLFLLQFKSINEHLHIPFVWIELQTSGVFCKTEEQMRLLKEIGVNTISLSLSNIFSDDSNQEMCGTSNQLKVNIEETCMLIKSYGFNLRLSLNMTSVYATYNLNNIYDRAKELGADQVTFRKLYYVTDNNKEIQNWIVDNRLSDSTYNALYKDCKHYGTALQILPFGATKYDYKGISMVFDEDCMEQNLKDTLKYLILRPNCKLYSHWNTPASLIF